MPSSLNGSQPAVMIRVCGICAEKGPNKGDAFLMAGFTENILVLLVAIALQIVSLVVLIRWQGVKLEAYRLSNV